MIPLEFIKVQVLHGDPLLQVGLLGAIAQGKDFEAIDGTKTVNGEVEASRCSDVFVTDYMRGLEELKRPTAFDQQGRSARVVIVTGKTGEGHIRAAIDRNVRGYLSNECSLSDLSHAIRVVAKGARSYSATVNRQLGESLIFTPLSSREIEVLRCVVDGLCNKQVSRTLGITVGTVKSHLKTIFGKLDVDSRTQAVATATRRGLLTEVPSARVENHLDHVGRETIAPTDLDGMSQGIRWHRLVQGAPAVEFA
jgi:DNA-binding NarL/FixJ family response regulator